MTTYVISGASSLQEVDQFRFPDFRKSLIEMTPIMQFLYQELISYS